MGIQDPKGDTLGWEGIGSGCGCRRLLKATNRVRLPAAPLA